MRQRTFWRWKVGEEVVAGVGLPTYRSWFVWWCGRIGLPGNRGLKNVDVGALIFGEGSL